MAAGSAKPTSSNPAATFCSAPASSPSPIAAPARSTFWAASGSSWRAPWRARPRLLLLDEIAGGLTEAECIELVALIQDIKQSGVTIVWIEHIVHALLAVVSRLVVLNFGRKIIEGEPRAVMASDQVREIYMGIAA